MRDPGEGRFSKVAKCDLKDGAKSILSVNGHLMDQAIRGKHFLS